MKNESSPAFLIALLIITVAVFGWLEILSWHHCLESNSWWYCLRVLGR